ncbi:hypothetical protein DF044_02290 [Burkholderia contaminans]|nr:hypothetical protein DF044_02290 [Burkholderia contaminans]
MSTGRSSPVAASRHRHRQLANWRTGELANWRTSTDPVRASGKVGSLSNFSRSHEHAPLSNTLQ